MTDTERLAALVTAILVDMEEDRLCGDCLADTCEKHDEMPETGIGCGDGKELAARLIAAGVLAPLDRTELATAIREGFTDPDRRLDDSFEIYESAYDIADEIIAQLAYTEDDPDWAAIVSPIDDRDGGHDDR